MHKDQEILSKNFSLQITSNYFGVISREKKFYLQQYPFTLLFTLLWITLNHLIISYIHTRHKQNSQRITHRNSIHSYPYSSHGWYRWAQPLFSTSSPHTTTLPPKREIVWRGRDDCKKLYNDPARQREGWPSHLNT